MTNANLNDSDTQGQAKFRNEALAYELERCLQEAQRLKKEAEEARNSARQAHKLADDVAQLAMQNPNPLIKVDCEKDSLLFVNPAAYNKYSDILIKGTKHPLLADIHVVAQDAYRIGRSVTREVIVGAIIYQQVVTPYLLAEERAVTVYNYDITKLKEIEENLRRERENAEAANRSKSDFLANMSHELRTPMNGVLGMASLLKDTLLDHEQTELVGTICNSGETLLLLLNDILDFSKIEAGQITLENIPFDIVELVQSTTRLLEPMALKKNVALSVSIGPDIPAYIVGDPARLRQIVTNLVGNAIKFTSQGSVRLSLLSDSIEDLKHALRINVDDTGIGILPEHLEKIFHKFTQADETTTRRFGGTGLGLTISKLLTEKMGGHVGVESTVNKGSRFWFVIPFARVNEEQTHELKVANQPAQSNDVLRPSTQLQSSRILVIDDHPINLLFAKKLLQKFGCAAVDTVDNGGDALRLLAAGRFDLVITDCQMPEMDGYEVSRAIRATEQVAKQRIPIIAMTANAMVGDREKCLAAGMDDYVSKPINEGRLLNVLVRWLKLTDPGSLQSPTVAASSAMCPTVPQQPIDLTHLFHVLGDDPQERQEVIAMFLVLAEQALQIMLDSLHSQDTTLWSKTAHKLKGSAANFGAHELAEFCQTAEAATAADVGQRTTMFLAMRHALSEVKTCLDIALR